MLGSIVFVTFIALSLGYSLTREPWWDEGLFVDVAITFRNHGHLGSSTLDSHGFLPLPEVDRFTYWQFPLYLVSLGNWFRFVPATAIWMRVFSVVWGCVYVVCWFLIVRHLSGKESLALLVSSVVALNYATIAAASDGRMDMICAGLGYAGIASYICLRESGWTRAAVLAACFGAASLFCHPMGALMTISMLGIGVLDRPHISGKRLSAVCLPYVVGALLCFLYILQAPNVFFAQSKAASGYRLTGGWALTRNLLNDAYLRYFQFYFGQLNGINKLKSASLLFAVVGTLALALNRKRISDPLGRILLMLVCVAFVGVAVIDNQKIPVYFVYSLPVMSACGAVWTYDCWQRGGLVRVLSSALLVSSVLSAVGGFWYKIYLNPYDHLYKPAMAVVKQVLPPGGLIMGGSELGFALGFGSHLIDDRYLGYFSKRRADVFVQNQYYGGVGPAWHYTRAMLQTEYHLCFENALYRIYVRNHVE
jgi:hypothetical protein